VAVIRSGRPWRGFALDSWVRLAAIIATTAISAVWEEMLIISAEFMMLLRWLRDVIRYDLRWVVQEKLRLVARGRRSVEE
jgi:hypothetical protein